MDQGFQSTRDDGDSRSFSVSAPNDYDGIGQALRSAYRDHRDPPDHIAAALNALDQVD